MKLFWTPYELELRHTFTISGFSRKTTPVVLTKIEYDGLVGYGEASLPQYLGETQASVIDFLKRVDFSSFQNPTNIDEILEYVDNIAPNNNSAKASIYIALHDLAGKIIGKPWLKYFAVGQKPISGRLLYLRRMMIRSIKWNRNGHEQINSGGFCIDYFNSFLCFLIFFIAQS